MSLELEVETFSHTFTGKTGPTGFEDCKRETDLGFREVRG